MSYEHVFKGHSTTDLLAIQSWIFAGEVKDALCAELRARALKLENEWKELLRRSRVSGDVKHEDTPASKDIHPMYDSIIDNDGKCIMRTCTCQRGAKPDSKCHFHGYSVTDTRTAPINIQGPVCTCILTEDGRPARLQGDRRCKAPGHFPMCTCIKTSYGRICEVQPNRRCVLKR